MFSSLLRRDGTPRRVTLGVESLDGRILPSVAGGFGIELGHPGAGLGAWTRSADDVSLTGGPTGGIPSKMGSAGGATGDYHLTGGPAGGIPSKIATSAASADEVNLMGSAGGAIPPFVR